MTISDEKVCLIQNQIFVLLCSLTKISDVRTLLSLNNDLNWKSHFNFFQGGVRAPIAPSPLSYVTVPSRNIIN